MKSHAKNFKRPDTVGLMKEGGIIGTEDVDKSYSRKPNIWYLADSEVELIKIPRQSFNEFWKGQITFEFDFKFYSVIVYIIFLLGKSVIVWISSVLPVKILEYKKNQLLLTPTIIKYEIGIEKDEKGLSTPKLIEKEFKNLQKLWKFLTNVRGHNLRFEYID